MNEQGKPYKAVLFDIDGTLLDSNDAHAASFVRAFHEFGKTISFFELKWLIGMGADKILEKFLSPKEIERFGERLTARRKEIFLADYLPRLEKFAKVDELFRKLKKDGLRIALASSASREELEKYHGILKIDRYLDRETSSDDADASKPEPDIFLAALEKLEGVRREQTLVVGDTPFDAEAARRAGLKIVGVKTGGWSRRRLLGAGCVEVYDDVDAILGQYDSLF